VQTRKWLKPISERLKVLLSVKDIRVYYEGAEVIHGISLQLPEGKIVSIIGANGAGKSTILKTIMGLKQPAEGEIWFQNYRIDQLPVHRIISMGLALVPEGKKLFHFMTVIENLRLGAYIQKESRQLMANDIEVVFEYFPRLRERKRQKAGTLSGGEQQMLSIGRALMAKPKLLLMDEPSLGLAPIMIAHIAKTIAKINMEGVSILLVEQNASLALKLANEAYALENGLVVLQGVAKDMMENEAVRRAYLGG
jgi:branched-chain amino acid transport system ATP-binding protein